MWKNYLKIAFRNLWNTKFYSLINIFGLAIGIACCIMIVLYILDEVSYDKHFKHSERIYRTTNEVSFGGNYSHYAVTPAPMASALVEDYPYVEVAGRFRTWGDYLVKVNEDDQNVKEKEVVFADSSIFNVFSIPFIQGDANKVLKEPYTVVISESVAKNYFNTTDVVGKHLIFDNENKYRIDGVIEDLPENTHFDFNIYLSLLERGESKSDHWLSNNFHTYFRLKEGVDVKKFESQIREDLLYKYIGPQITNLLGTTYDDLEAQGNFLKYHIQPLEDIHLYSEVGIELGQNGDIKYVYIFITVAIIILLIACINFINLSTSRSIKRSKEVGIRKTLGSQKRQLVIQFLVESLMISFFALIIGLIIVEITLPLFNHSFDKHIVSDYFHRPILSGILIFILILTGLVAGSYPALRLSSYKPVDVLKGIKITGKGSFTLRNFLVVGQFAISIILIIGTLVIVGQLNYIQNKKLGFEKDRVLIIKDVWGLNDQAKVFKKKVNDLANVEYTSLTSFLPVEGYARSDNMHWRNGVNPDPQTSVSMQTWWTDGDYFNTLGLEIISGRAFDTNKPADSATVLLNESAIDMFGFEGDPVGQYIHTFAYDDEKGQVDKENILAYKVIGVVKNFHFNSMKQTITALGIFNGENYGTLMVKMKSDDYKNTLSNIKKLWSGFTKNQPFQYSFLDDDFESMYVAEQRVKSLMLVFSGLAIFVACLGLFGLSAFTAEKRFKEIGVRKVMGAETNQVVVMLLSGFMKLVFVAYIIGVPIAWFAMKRWLEDFAYKTEISPKIILLALVPALIIALVTVSFQSIKAALSDPVKALRTE
ncbi:ABC transporter permease [Marinigracilibium pacificum]|uniref:FtsX-like permease family protein n=1 Tax=Marinigracilibium pacificum TaxID=2729599 RepID=A0A848JAP4_9BACT|nr:ABC transporter permease [Marinigracilibium pacificum]NMM50112.1 FtsX-like permease family protein [Marinigracilibium pacificum]